MGKSSQHPWVVCHINSYKLEPISPSTKVQGGDCASHPKKMIQKQPRLPRIVYNLTVTGCPQWPVHPGIQHYGADEDKLSMADMGNFIMRLLFKLNNGYRSRSSPQ